ncbi:MAG: thermonuclease family protein [Candidatus Pacearchaeota archaeon]
MDKKRSFFIALLLTLLIVAAFYFSRPASSSNERQAVIITRVIDGDTLEADNNITIRLININTPEKGAYGAELASNFLKSYENRSVEIEITGNDKYERALARIFAPEYINLKIVKEGLACKFLVDSSELKQFANAEDEAIKNSRGIWNHSPFYNCIESEINQYDEIISLKTKCGQLNMSGWIIKDESRKMLEINAVLSDKIKIHSGKGENNITDLFWQSSSNIWNNDRDTLYIYDEEGRIVHHDSYGY